MFLTSKYIYVSVLTCKYSNTYFEDFPYLHKIKIISG